MFRIALFAAALLFLSPATSAQGDSCRACNCQFNNVQVLDRLIESKINKCLANDPGKIKFTAAVYCMSDFIPYTSLMQ